MKLEFEGEELELVMEAVRAAVPAEDPLGDKILLKYLTKKFEEQESAEGKKRKIGFIQ